MLEESEALNELKRVDHLIFVTLKYTRSVDIIRNILQRIISAIDYQVTEVIEHFRQKGKVGAVSNVPLVRCKMLEDFYYSVRKILNSEYKKKEEYRKNVALITRDVEIDIEKLKEYAKKTKNYIYYLRSLIM